MATYSSILAWESPWTDEPGRLLSMGLQRVGHNSMTEHAHTHTQFSSDLNHSRVFSPRYSLPSIARNYLIY